MPQHAQLCMHVHCPSKALAVHTKNSVDTPCQGMGTLAHATMFFAAIGPSLSSNNGTLGTMPMASAMPWLGNFPIEKKRCPPPTLPACRLQCTFAPRIFCPPPVNPHFLHCTWQMAVPARPVGAAAERRPGRGPAPAQGHGQAGAWPGAAGMGRPEAWSGARGMGRPEACTGAQWQAEGLVRPAAGAGPAPVQMLPDQGKFCFQH